MTISDASKRWLPEYQIFRGLATLEIIIRHATWPLGVAGLLLVPHLSREIVTVIAASAYTAIPQFLFISGAVLFNKYRRDFSLSEFYKKRVNTVLWPYIIFSAFYFFYPYAHVRVLQLLSSHPVAGVNGIPLTRGFLFGLATGSIAHLWFILLILQLYALYPLIVKGYNRIAQRRNITIGVLLALLAIQVLYTVRFVGVRPYSNDFMLMRGLFLSGIFYFVLGIAVRDRYDWTKQKVANVPMLFMLLVVALFTTAYSVGFYNTFLVRAVTAQYVWLYELMAPAYSVILIAFYLKISLLWAEPRNVITRSVAKVGEDSFGIYLVHYYYLLLFGGWFVRLGLTPANLVYYPLIVVAMFAASYVTVHAIYRLPFSEIIIGRPRRRSYTEPSKERQHPSPPAEDGHIALVVR